MYARGADVIAKRSETEVSRLRESVRRFGSVWTTIEGTNPVEELRREIPLRAGETKTIKDQYKVYVRE